MIKYPRTPHLVGSRLQPGDVGKGQVSIRSIPSGCSTVWEEKVDGGNAGLCFRSGRPVLQSRGHVLSGGPRETQFDLFKTYVATFEDEFRRVLGERYLVFFEFMHALHSVYYDALPHYLLEFDVYDRRDDRFLSTPARRTVLEGAPFPSVHVVSEDRPGSDRDVPGLVGRSVYRTEGWRDALERAVVASGQKPSCVVPQVDADDLAEGVYLKVEKGDEVVGRHKWVRHSFLQTVLSSEGHWSERRIVENGLADGVDLFAYPYVEAGVRP